MADPGHGPSAGRWSDDGGWGGVGRGHQEDVASPLRGFGWAAVGALCLAVVLSGVAFLTAEQRAAAPRGAPAVAEAPVQRVPPASVGGGGGPAGRELFDLSAGATQGWGFGDWQPGSQGRVAPAVPPDRGLSVVSPGGWFEAHFADPVDFGGARTLTYDVDGSGTDVLVALKVGPQETWCQASRAPVPAGPATVSVDLASLGCDPKAAQPADLSAVHAVEIWFSRGSFTLGSVRLGGGATG